MGKKVVLTPGLDKCIFVFSQTEWKKISEKLSQSSMLSADSRSFNRFLLGGAVETEVDSIGRILIPDFLKSRASLSSKVAVVGVQTRVELWGDRAWTEYKQVVEKEADTLAEKLGQVGML